MGNREAITYILFSCIFLLGIFIFFVIPNRKRLERINVNLDNLEDIIKDLDEE